MVVSRGVTSKLVWPQNLLIRKVKALEFFYSSPHLPRSLTYSLVVVIWYIVTEIFLLKQKINRANPQSFHLGEGGGGGEKKIL